MHLIQLRNIHKTYTLGEVEVHALQNVTLDIDRGEYIALMGPSGSGKTTLMNTLGCLDHPTSGSYLLDGEEVLEMSCDERARLRNRKIGFVFQNFNLLSRTSALENVGLPLLYSSRMHAGQRRERARRFLEKVGLESRCASLSVAALRRPAATRGHRPRLVNEPPILLADEPTGNLDSHTSREVMDVFRQLNEEDGITIILVTHDQDVARHACRTVVLRDGQVDVRLNRFRVRHCSLAHAGRANAMKRFLVWRLVVGDRRRRCRGRLHHFARLGNNDDERYRTAPGQAGRHDVLHQIQRHRPARAERAGRRRCFRADLQGLRRLQRQS